ncbi:MAG: InlB B-repeat-containing protein [Erysipelothrix sp.]
MKKIGKLCLALLLCLMMFPLSSTSTYADSSEYSDDIKSFLKSWNEEYEVLSPKRDPENDQDFDEISGTITDLSLDDQVDYNTVIFDYKGLERFSILSDLEIPIVLNTETEVKNLKAFPNSLYESGLRIRPVMYDNDNQKYILLDSDEIGGAIVPSDFEIYRVNLEHKLISLSSQYVGKRMSVEFLSADYYLKNYNWLDGLSKSLYYEFEAEMPERYIDVPVKSLKIDDVDFYEMNITNAMMPKVIATNENAYRTADATEKTIALSMPYIYDYFVDGLESKKFIIEVTLSDGRIFIADQDYETNLDEDGDIYKFFNDDGDDPDESIRGEVETINVKFEKNDTVFNNLTNHSNSVRDYKEKPIEFISDYYDGNGSYSDSEGIIVKSYYRFDNGGTWELETDNIVINPIFVPYLEKTANVYFNSHGGTDVAPQLELPLNEFVQKPANPTKEGFTFEGWYVDEAYTALWNFDTDTVTSNLTLHAKWSENPVVVEKFDVTFNSHGGTTVAPQLQLEAGSKVQKPANPTKEGFTFEGWYVDEAYTALWNFDTDTVTSNLTLHAKWSENPVVVEKYDVTFNSHGGTTVAPQLQLEAGSSVMKPIEPTRVGFTFEGWYVDEAYTTLWNFDTDTVTSNLTLHAKWSENPVVVEKFDVTFNSHGGTTVAPQLQLEAGSKVQKPANPTKEGFTFEGWYVDEAYTALWNFDTDTVTSNLTLHAKWSENDTDEKLPSTGVKNSIMLPAMLVMSGLSLVVLKLKKD